MLEITLNNQTKILTVKETIMSFTESKSTYWYYDIKNWKKSYTGNKDDIRMIPMLKEAIEWCKTYYIPKATIIK